jgi:uncharacterized SAM-binding protein YcdF (DUF218 family)
MFYLSRMVVELLSPLNLTCILLATGITLQYCGRVKVGRVVITIGFSLLVVTGYAPGVTAYLKSQEERYQPILTQQLDQYRANARFVVVLGSSHVSDERLPETSQIGGSSLYRLVEGIRLQRELPGTRLLICGGVGYDPVPNARVVGAVARQLGVTGETIVIIDTPRDTMQEAAEVVKHVGSDPFFLVTSALHMRRAMSIFQGRGMQPIAAPTDYLIKQHHRSPAASLLPSTTNIERCRRILYEWIASLWLKIQKI